MQFVSFLIGFAVGLLTVLMVQQRVVLKPLRNPDNIADTLYQLSMPLGLLGAVLAGVWLTIGFNAESIQGVWFLGLALFAGFTIFVGVMMFFVFDEGDRIRKEHRRLQKAYEGAARSQRTGR